MKIVGLEHPILLRRTNIVAVASKFFEHFVLISDAMTYRAGEKEASLWNHEDGFYYDAISWGSRTQQYVLRAPLASSTPQGNFHLHSLHILPSEIPHEKAFVLSGKHQLSFQSYPNLLQMFRSHVGYTLLHKGDLAIEQGVGSRAGLVQLVLFHDRKADS